MGVTPLGPNVKRLLFTKMAFDAIPDGSGFNAGVEFLSSKESIIAGYRKAAEWTKSAIKAVREAAEPNPYKTSSDEEIAEALVKNIETKRRNRNARNTS